MALCYAVDRKFFTCPDPQQRHTEWRAVPGTAKGNDDGLRNLWIGPSGRASGAFHRKTPSIGRNADTCSTRRTRNNDLVRGAIGIDRARVGGSCPLALIQGPDHRLTPALRRYSRCSIGENQGDNVATSNISQRKTKSPAVFRRRGFSLCVGGVSQLKMLCQTSLAGLAATDSPAT